MREDVPVTIFGERGRPWVIACGIEKDSDLGKTLRQMAAVVTYLEGDDPNLQVRQSDYDAIVVAGDVHNLDGGINILQFGRSPSYDQFHFGEAEASFSCVVSLDDKGRAGQLEVHEELPAEVADLAQRSLAPWLLGVSPRYLLRPHRYSYGPGAQEIPVPKIIDAFVSERIGDACAGRWFRPTDSADAEMRVEHWWLPADCPDQSAWVRAAFAHWSRQQPHRFPNASAWESSPEWMTKVEIETAQKLAEAEDELTRVTTELIAQRDRIQEDLAVARDAANRTERRLLTAQGDDLKAETRAALLELGFLVSDSDAARTAEGSSLLEDLEVRDGSDWVAIAEVRGYARGAKTSDFQRLARAARGFERRNGREPSARWYIVNHGLAKPPNDRRAVLAGAESDVAEFAIDGGCVIDTRDLFRLRELVKSGQLSSERLRQLLRECRGIFDTDGKSL